MAIKLLFTQTTDSNPPNTVTVDLPSTIIAGELIVSIRAQASRSVNVAVEGFRIDVG